MIPRSNICIHTITSILEKFLRVRGIYRYLRIHLIDVQLENYVSNNIIINENILSFISFIYHILHML